MRLVLDTNVIISGLLIAGSPSDRLRQAWVSGRFKLVSSEWQIDELRRVSRYPQLKARFAPHEAGRLISRIRKHADIVKPAPGVVASPDPDDNPILATAIAGDAQYVVTGDKNHLLSLAKIGSIRIITARAAIELLR